MMVSKPTESGVASSKHHRGTTMNYYAGIDVSLEDSCICVIDASGKVVREGKVSSEPTALIAWLSEVGVTLTRIGLEAGPLSQWLYAAIQQAGGSGQAETSLCGIDNASQLADLSSSN